MTTDEARRLPLGLYRLFWLTGGLSVAAVGQTEDGSTWYAPTNWLWFPGAMPLKGGVPSLDWGAVERVELITTQQREKELLMENQHIGEPVKVSYDELARRIESSGILPYSRWRHYKGGHYVVIGNAILEATQEVVVLYQAVDSPVVMVRPVTAWREEVEHDGQRVQRFTAE